MHSIFRLHCAVRLNFQPSSESFALLTGLVKLLIRQTADTFSTSKCRSLVNATIIMIMVIQRSVISEASRSWIASSPKWLPSCAKKVATVTLQDHTFRVSSFSRFSNSTSNNMNAFRSAVGHRVGFFFIFVQYSSRPRVP